MATSLSNHSLLKHKDFGFTAEKLPPLSISEGKILRTKENQGIDFNMLSSCFTLTAQFLDQTLLGAHFAHFGQEAGGKNPKELLKIFSKVLKVATDQANPLIKLQIIGHLHFWNLSLLGLTERPDCSLAEERAEQSLATFLHVPSSKIQVIDTSLKANVYLSIQADGMKANVYLSIQADGMPDIRSQKEHKDSSP